jgi:hypothetical protein
MSSVASFGSAVVSPAGTAGALLDLFAVSLLFALVAESLPVALLVESALGLGLGAFGCG